MFSFGKNIKMTIFGASHQECVGVVFEGLKAGLSLDFAEIEAMLERRRAKNDPAHTARQESDICKIISGLAGGKTCGAPLVAIFENADTKSGEYNKFIPRPGHSDYSAFIKYDGQNDFRGGGFFSGRMTVAMCFAGAIAKQILKERGITVEAGIDFIGGDIKEAKECGDSLGGKISCMVKNLPAGIGEPLFNSIESVVSHALFSIPAVKGVEFGKGFEFCKLKGSEANDQMEIQDGKPVFKTNNNGGILGGISNGMPIEIKVAIKPTPSIFIEQDTINLQTMQNEKLKISGRHDVCIAIRAVPVVESMTAFAILDLLLEK